MLTVLINSLSEISDILHDGDGEAYQESVEVSFKENNGIK